jgi:hypothetical protein
MDFGFAPIALDDYVALHLQDNPAENRIELINRLRSAVAAHREGVRCSCGAPLWIIGSAQAGHGCFACITGESTPDGDYEIVVVTDRT